MIHLYRSFTSTCLTSYQFVSVILMSTLYLYLSILYLYLSILYLSMLYLYLFVGLAVSPLSI